MYIELKKEIINLKNIQKAYIFEKQIIIEYPNRTISINYEDIRDNVNEEKQLIDKDFEKLENYLVNNLEQKINEQKDYIQVLEKHKSNIISIKYFLQMKISKSKKLKMIGDLIDE